mmetsp:Transcript_6228/g.10152  ORF Transcript_6228/g.10152 Transcript_6228/m.10152 type:complete len:134 (-) Transcript_6228:36-437(-)
MEVMNLSTLILSSFNQIVNIYREQLNMQSFHQEMEASPHALVADRIFKASIAAEEPDKLFPQLAINKKYYKLKTLCLKIIMKNNLMAAKGLTEKEVLGAVMLKAILRVVVSFEEVASGQSNKGKFRLMRERIS